MPRRVVVTGIGVISPLGLSAGEHFEALCGGASGLAAITAFEVGGFPVKFAGEVKGFRANKFLKNRKALKIMARDIQLAVAAASLAARDARVYDGSHDPTRFGVSMGAGLISTELDELGAAAAASTDETGSFDLKKYGKEGLANLAPLWLLKYLPNMLNSHIAIEHDARGPNNCITCGNASGLLAVGEAVRVIQRNQADMMIAGAAESKVHPLSLVRLYLAGKLSTSADVLERGPRPFAEKRSGTVVGEAGAVLILEEESHARKRGARIYARAAGFGCGSGQQIVEELAADGKAAKRVMEKALSDGGVERRRVDAVFANASGLPEDSAEAAAIAEVFGDSKSVVSTRAATGHTMAAAGALDAANACMALDAGVLPGTFGADDAGGLPVLLSSESRKGDLNAALVNAFTFGGQVSSLALEKLT